MPDERLRGDGDEALVDVVQVVEEVARIGVRQVDRGGLRVTTATETRQETLPIHLTDEVVDVTRVPIDQVVETMVDTAIERDGDDEITVVPVYAERAVVRTELILVEQIRIRRRRVTRDDAVTVDLRRQTAAVETLPPNPVEE